MASYNGERCIRMWELPSFEARGTLGDVNNARAMAGSASAQLVFSGDEHGRVKVRAAWGIHHPAGLMWARAGWLAGWGRGAQELWGIPLLLHLVIQSGPLPPPCLPLQVYKWKAVGPGGFPQ